jgi:hypothetical protein
MIEFSETHALQCLAKGEATPEQQKLAIDVILHKICRIRHETFKRDSERETLYAQGVRGAGLAIVKELETDLLKLREEQKNDRRNRTTRRNAEYTK